MIGATWEATSRVFGDFAVRGLIRSGRGRVLLTDPAGLRLLGRDTA
ncbi:hypothetical protein CFK38_10425 [Brachybacterium vulturis]|uniref:HTH crp-type domain-containing protein n=1 Tax=Brachybacterium vulturis TaxID=2017484 RepID=A0A291GNX8_9MICO|nr:hypothetical protein CFK38_10425 [Brachybacterium vulturis]